MRGWILYPRVEKDLGEKDYSIKRLLEAGRAKGVELTVYSPRQFELLVSKEDDRKSILVDGKKTPLPDFVLPRMGSNTTYFALAIIRQLEKSGVYVCNSSVAIETVKDKLHMHQLLAHSNLPTPKTMLLKFPVDVDTVRREIGFPIIIKNVSGQQGAGIYLCQSEDKFTDLMELIESNNAKANIILQEFIAASSGKDLRIFIVGGKIIGSMKRSSSSGFKANFSRGGKVEPVELSQDAEWLALEAARLVDLDIVGIDLLFESEGFKVCEANSAPGFKGLEEAIGINIADILIDYIVMRAGGSA